MVPARWISWIFQSKTPAVEERAPPSYVTISTAIELSRRKPPGWRDILERIPHVAAATPLGIQSLFTAAELARIDAFAALFLQIKTRQPWLVAVVQCLRALRGVGGPRSTSGRMCGIPLTGECH